MVVLANNSEPSFSTEPGEMTEWLEFWKLTLACLCFLLFALMFAEMD